MIILGLITGGNLLAETTNDDPFKPTALRMHMTMGNFNLVLMLVRLVTRLVTSKPPHAEETPAESRANPCVSAWYERC